MGHFLRCRGRAEGDRDDAGRVAYFVGGGS